VRRNLDAVGVLLYQTIPGHEPRVFLRRTLRPALLVREHRDALTPGDKPPGQLLTWREPPIILESVAGILEGGETTESALKARAVAEVWEETGIRSSADQLLPLGHWFYPTPGMNPEAIHLYAAPVAPETAESPPGDGSPTEEIGGLVAFSLTEALSACVSGRIRDAKSEIALHRFAARKD
jgi:8-oxo-dGTP pyrophosphatase MutT (NUDIX family)